MLQVTLKRREKVLYDSEEVQGITAKIAQMIAMSDPPFVLVEDLGRFMTNYLT